MLYGVEQMFNAKFKKCNRKCKCQCEGRNDHRTTHVHLDDDSDHTSDESEESTQKRLSESAKLPLLEFTCPLKTIWEAPEAGAADVVAAEAGEEVLEATAADTLELLRFRSNQRRRFESSGDDLRDG